MSKLIYVVAILGALGLHPDLHNEPPVPEGWECSDGVCLPTDEWKGW